MRLVWSSLLLIAHQTTPKTLNSNDQAYWTNLMEKEESVYLTVKTIPEFLKTSNELRGTGLLYEYVKARWNYYTDMSPENSEISKLAQMSYLRLDKKIMPIALKLATAENLNALSVEEFRAFDPFTKAGLTVLTDEEQQEYTDIRAKMSAIYSTTKIDGLSLNPEIEGIIGSSRNKTELDYFWREWHHTVGKQIKPLYVQYVEILNKVAKSNDYADASEMWLTSYTEVKALNYTHDDFITEVDSIWSTLQPLYKKLHAYVRSKLVNVYPEIETGGTIPSSVVGNMWAQTWTNLYPLVEPYPEETLKLDVTDELVKQNYTAERIFKLSEEFFTSLGMRPMTNEFWEKSMLVRPAGKDVVCHASAWNLNDINDTRIKQCTGLTHDDLITTHHEMGHIQYYLQYNDLPYNTFKTGANPGFHEAIGDTLALSVSTPKHLKAIGLLKDDIKPSEKQTVNFLLNVALKKIAFLPFGLLIDKYRWRIFKGEIQPDDYQREWHQMRKHYQGLHPIDEGLEFFDAGAKYHVPNGVPYIRYFASYILQFQFYKAMCLNQPVDESLHECDFYHDREAGDLMKAGLKLGASKPWQDILEAMTGSRTISAEPFREYFAPLEKWLDAEIEEKSIPVGW